jgi:hypothetical protein
MPISRMLAPCASARASVSFAMFEAPYRYQLLAPTSATINNLAFRRDAFLHQTYLRAAQNLRGRVYLQDGAIKQSHLTEGNAFAMSGDRDCWHFLLVDKAKQVIGCARFLLHPRTALYEDLRISRSPLSMNTLWSSKLRRVVESALNRTRQEGIGYAELGGWAIAPEYRHTRAALEILIGSYAWAELIGHCICSCTATVRNSSSAILRRIGAHNLESDGQFVPVYFDEQYGCDMELLGFDSRKLPPKFLPILNEMRPKLTQSLIIQGSPWQEEWHFSEVLAHARSATSAPEQDFQAICKSTVLT